MTSAERYRLVRTVGSGGMAQIMEAVARGMDGFERRVAIKRLLPEHARNGEHRRMFLQEARITSRLHHGGIVAIFDYGIIDGSAFLAMEFIDGLDALRAVSSTPDGKPMPEGIALHLVAEIGHALAYIHGVRDEQNRPLGIVHRDVSPQNILLSWDGDVRLSDFGIASSYRRQELTMGGAIKGKLRFMAPEQARGEHVTSAADIYALGATLDALLGGDAAGPATTKLEIDRRVHQARLRKVSPGVCALIRACLAGDPERRPHATAVAARAGVLASQRLGRDGRGALRAWLKPLRETAKRSSALDDLMGLCLVPVGPAGDRTFTVTQLPAHTSDISDVPDAAPGTSDAHEPAEPAVRRPATLQLTPAMRTSARAAMRRPTRMFMAGAVLGCLLVAGETRVFFPLAAAPSVPGAAPIAQGRPELTQALLASSGVGSPRRLAPAKPGRPVGWLRVGGPNLAGARVSVDGASAGFAPVELARPVGAHKISIVGATSGRTLLRKTVRLGDQHTRVAPLRILH